MLSPGQIPLYWRLWSGVLAARGWQHLSPAEKDLRRHEFHKSLGLPESMTGFNKRGHFDAYKAAAQRIIKGEGPSAATAGEDGERKRLVWRIKEDAKLAGLDAAYIQKLAVDLYGLGAWQHLHLNDLTNLRNTIHDRAGTRLGSDTRTLAPRRAYVLDSTRKFTPKPQPEPIPVHAEADPF